MAAAILAAACAKPLAAMLAMSAAAWALYKAVKALYERSERKTGSDPVLAAARREAAYCLDKQRCPVYRAVLPKDRWRRFRPGKTLEGVDPKRLLAAVMDAEYDAFCRSSLETRLAAFRERKRKVPWAVRRACLGTYRYALYRMEPGIDIEISCQGRRGRLKTGFLTLPQAHAWLAAVQDHNKYPPGRLLPADAFRMLEAAGFRCQACGAAPDAGSPVTVSEEDGRTEVLCGACRAERSDAETTAAAAESIQAVMRSLQEKKT